MEHKKTFVTVRIRANQDGARLPASILSALSKISGRTPEQVETLIQTGPIKLPKVAENEQLRQFVDAITQNGFKVDITPLAPPSIPKAPPPPPPVEETDPSEGTTEFSPDQTANGFLSDLTIANWREGDLIEGLYEIRGSAAGGMGRVYFVFHRVWKMMLAIKTPLAQAVRSETSLMRFLREAELWVDVGLHPNIATCYYARVIGGLPRLFIEYVDGGNLEDLIEQRRLTTLKPVCDLMMQFCHGMIHAQEKGMIHRDVKPANCLLSRDGHLKITDFGLVKRRGATPLSAARACPAHIDDASCGPDITAIEGGIMGSPLYMAPERFTEDGAGDDVRSDVYSFGIMFYRAVLGRLPYNFPGGISLKSVVRSHVHSEPVDPLRIMPNLPKDIVGIMLTCLNKKPEDRYPSFVELSAALEGFWSAQWPSGKMRRRPDVVGLKADSLNNHAVSLLDLGKEDEARRLLEDAHSADPDHLQAVYNLYALRWLRAEASDMEVVNRLRSLRIEVRDTPDYQHLLGLVMLQRGAASKAAVLLRSACDQGAHFREIWSEFPGGSEGFISSLKLEPIEDRIGFAGHVKRILALGFTPQSDKAVSIGEDRTIRVWDPASGRCLKTVRTVSFTPVAACVSSDALYAATSYGAAFRTADIWDLSRGVSIKKLREVAGVALSFSQDGALLVSVQEDGRVDVINVAEGRTVWSRARSNAPVTCSIFLQGTEKLACGSADGALLILDEKDGAEISRISAHEGPVSCLDYSETDDTLLTGGLDETIRIFNVRSGRTLGKLTGHQGRITGVRFFWRDKYALSASSDGVLKTWNVRTGRCVRTIRFSGEGVTACAAAPDGKTLIGGDAKGAVRIWSYDAGWFDKDFLDPAICRPKTFRELAEAQHRFAEAVENFRRSWKAGDKEAARDGFAKMVGVPGFSWSREAVLARNALFADPELPVPTSAVFIRSLRGHTGPITALASSPDGMLLLTGSLDGTLILWDVVTGDAQTKIIVGRPVRGVWFVSGDAPVVAVDDDMFLRMWDIDGRLVRQAPGVRPPFLDDDALETLHAVTPKGVPFQVNLRSGVVRQGSVSLPLEQLSCFARSGQYVYTVRDKTRIQRWSIATGRYEGAFRDVGVKVSSLAPSKDDARLIAGLETGEIAVCKVDAAVDVSILRGHKGPVRALCAGPRSGLFVSGADDCTLRIWNIASTGPIHVLEGHSSPIRAVHFSPTGVMVAGGASDGSVRLWGLDWAPRSETEKG